MRIVFQGDSVTDAGRNYADPHHLGSGYPKYTAEELRRLLPDIEMEFINQGISGNRTADLLERWEKDCLAYRPDVLSLMIGINDTWRRFDSTTPTLAPQYGDNLRRLLQQVKERTHAKICLIDPILLPTDETKNTWRFDLDEKIQILFGSRHATVYFRFRRCQRSSHKHTGCFRKDVSVCCKCPMGTDGRMLRSRIRY